MPLRIVLGDLDAWAWHGQRCVVCHQLLGVDDTTQEVVTVPWDGQRRLRACARHDIDPTAIEVIS